MSRGQRFRTVAGLLLAAAACAALFLLLRPHAARVEKNDEFTEQLKALEQNALALSYLKSFESITPFIEEGKEPLKLTIENSWHPTYVQKALASANWDHSAAIETLIAEREWLLSRVSERLAQSAVPEGQELVDLVGRLEADLKDRDENRLKYAALVDEARARMYREGVRILREKDVAGPALDVFIKDSVFFGSDLVIIELRSQFRQISLKQLLPEKYPDGPTPTRDLLGKIAFRKL